MRNPVKVTVRVGKKTPSAVGSSDGSGSGRNIPAGLRNYYLLVPPECKLNALGNATRSARVFSLSLSLSLSD